MTSLSFSSVGSWLDVAPDGWPVPNRLEVFPADLLGDVEEHVFDVGARDPVGDPAAFESADHLGRQLRRGRRVGDGVGRDRHRNAADFRGFSHVLGVEDVDPVAVAEGVLEGHGRPFGPQAAPGQDGDVVRQQIRLVEKVRRQDDGPPALSERSMSQILRLESASIPEDTSSTQQTALPPHHAELQLALLPPESVLDWAFRFVESPMEWISWSWSSWPPVPAAGDLSWLKMAMCSATLVPEDVLLRRDADAAGRVDGDAALVEPADSRNGIERRALAAAVRAEERQDLAALRRQVEVVDGNGRRPGLGDEGEGPAEEARRVDLGQPVDDDSVLGPGAVALVHPAALGADAVDLALDQGREQRVHQELDDEKDPDGDAGEGRRAVGRGPEQVHGLALGLEARHRLDEEDKGAGHEQQAQGRDGAGARVREGLGQDAQQDVDEGVDDAGKLGLLEEGRAEDGLGGQGQPAQDEEDDDDADVGLPPDHAPRDDGGGDPAGHVDGEEGVQVGHHADGLGLPLVPRRHHGVDELGQAPLALGGDVAREVVAHADEGEHEGDAEVVDDGLLVPPARAGLSLVLGLVREAPFAGAGKGGGGLAVVVVVVVVGGGGGDDGDGRVDGPLEGQRVHLSVVIVVVDAEPGPERAVSAQGVVPDAATITIYTTCTPLAGGGVKDDGAVAGRRGPEGRAADAPQLGRVLDRRRDLAGVRDLLREGADDPVDLAPREPVVDEDDRVAGRAVRRREAVPEGPHGPGLGDAVVVLGAVEVPSDAEVDGQDDGEQQGGVDGGGRVPGVEDGEVLGREGAHLAPERRLWRRHGGESEHGLISRRWLCFLTGCWLGWTLGKG
ncbi:retinitis pigmentosa GTPase regulator [Colletotrichum higginsianum]|nr:retinitis pigmentosa GTPase regulator [Colletotrichum higginsianum]